MNEGNLLQPDATVVISLIILVLNLVLTSKGGGREGLLKRLPGQSFILLQGLLMGMKVMK